MPHPSFGKAVSTPCVVCDKPATIVLESNRLNFSVDISRLHNYKLAWLCRGCVDDFSALGLILPPQYERSAAEIDRILHS